MQSAREFVGDQDAQRLLQLAYSNFETADALCPLIYKNQLRLAQLDGPGECGRRDQSTKAISQIDRT